MPIDDYLKELEGFKTNNNNRKDQAISFYNLKKMSLVKDNIPFAEEIFDFLNNYNLDVQIKDYSLRNDEKFIDLFAYGVAENIARVHYELLNKSDPGNLASEFFSNFSDLILRCKPSFEFPIRSRVNDKNYNIDVIFDLVQYANPVVDYRYKIKNDHTKIDLSLFLKT